MTAKTPGGDCSRQTDRHGNPRDMSQNVDLARPTVLSDDLRVAVERDLADGVPIAVAAQRAGVARRTLHRWLSLGLVVRRHLSAAPEPPPLQAESVQEERLVAAIAD